jgi:hypothetical protein
LAYAISNKGDADNSSNGKALYLNLRRVIAKYKARNSACRLWFLDTLPRRKTLLAGRGFLGHSAEKKIILENSTKHYTLFGGRLKQYITKAMPTTPVTPK